jgi:flagellar biosynthesis regulator FlaF
MAQMMFTVKYEQREFERTLRQYLDINKNANTKTEIRKRGRNVGMKMITIFAKSAPSSSFIKTKVQGLEYRVRTRPSIMKRTKDRDRQIAMELRARLNARKFTATGWFPPVEKLGGNPRRKLNAAKLRGPKRGKLVEKMGIFEKSETLYNEQPGAARTLERAGNAPQQALREEMQDMEKYIRRKQAQAAARGGARP